MPLLDEAAIAEFIESGFVIIKCGGQVALLTINLIKTASYNLDFLGIL